MFRSTTLVMLLCFVFFASAHADTYRNCSGGEVEPFYDCKCLLEDFKIKAQAKPDLRQQEHYLNAGPICVNKEKFGAVIAADCGAGNERAPSVFSGSTDPEAVKKFCQCMAREAVARLPEIKTLVSRYRNAFFQQSLKKCQPS